MSLDDNPMGGWMSDYDLFPSLISENEKGKELMKQPGFKTYNIQRACTCTDLCRYIILGKYCPNDD